MAQAGDSGASYYTAARYQVYVTPLVHLKARVIGQCASFGVALQVSKQRPHAHQSSLKGLNEYDSRGGSSSRVVVRNAAASIKARSDFVPCRAHAMLMLLLLQVTAGWCTHAQLQC
jgi:hypothetical protein